MFTKFSVDEGWLRLFPRKGLIIIKIVRFSQKILTCDTTNVVRAHYHRTTFDYSYRLWYYPTIKNWYNRLSESYILWCDKINYNRSIW